MSDMTVTPSVTIRSATADDVPAVARTLAAAFHDDPVLAWCLPDPTRRRAVLPGFFHLVTAAAVPHGEVMIGADRRAAALWVPPGSPAVPDADASAFEEAVADLVGEDSGRVFAVMAMLDEAHPTAPNRFLWFLGAHPEVQGRGRGSALLRDMLARCDADGSAAYLDATSEHNRRLYERHGFEVLDRHAVSGSPALYAMWRSPRLVG
jgi:ribosomal protein S18 acetylase RimI-like enzyme